MKLRTDSALLLCALLSAPAATANVWTGAASNEYGNTANWNPAAVPDGNTAADIGVSSPFPTVVTGNWDRRGTGVTTVSGTGSVTVPNGRFLNSKGTVNVTSGLVDVTGNYFIVGTDSNGVGTVNQSGGTVKVKHDRGFQLSDNSISQSGSTYNLSGTGVLNVISAPNFSDANLHNVWLGKGGESPFAEVTATTPGDLLNVTGGTATFTHDLSTNQTSEVRLSRNSRISISGGSVTFKDYNNFIVGHGASKGVTNRVEVSGGTLNIVNTSLVHVGYDDPGSLNISGGTVNAETCGLSLGGNASGGPAAGAGTVLMTGGTLRLSFLTAPNGTFDFRGGDLYLLDDYRDILDSEAYPWFITSEAAGAVTVEYDAVNLITHIHAAGNANPTGYAAWLAQYPGLADTTDAGDPDGDGISNIAEYVLNGNPGTASAAILPVSSLTTDSFVFTFTRVAATTGDTTQTFQYSSDLGTWTDVPANAASASVTITPIASTALETVQVKVPRTGTARIFGRLKASRP